MDRVDFPNLAARLRQNTVQEKLANLWLDHLLAGHVPHISNAESRALGSRRRASRRRAASSSAARIAR